MAKILAKFKKPEPYKPAHEASLSSAEIGLDLQKIGASVGAQAVGDGKPSELTAFDAASAATLLGEGWHIVPTAASGAAAADRSASESLIHKVATASSGSAEQTGIVLGEPDLGPTALLEPEGVPPEGSLPVSSVPSSGSYRADGLLFGAKWGGPVGTAVTVEYSFPADGAVWTVNYGPGTEPYSGFVPLSPTQQNAARKALQCWDEVCNITFVEVAESSTNVGVLRFGNSDLPPTGWAYYPTVNPVGGDIWFGKVYNYGSDVEGTYSFAAFMHEIGHAIGLKHPHDPYLYGALPESVDYLGNSIMSYRSYVGAPVNSGWSNSFFPTTPGIFDIATAQYLYGADTTTRVGNTTYSWSPGEQLFETIWDAGGVDTIDWANQSTSGIIRLTSGAWSKIGPGYYTSVGYLTNTLNIAYGCTIENARGGSAGDTIYGNTVANVISGNGGNDSCYGDSGNDTLNGNDGNDFLSGQNGNDRLVGGRGKDTLNGGSGNDTYDFNSASESAVGSNRDVVQSFFNPGSLTGDRFDLLDIDANVGVSGNQAFVWRGTGAFTGAGQLRVYNSDSNTIIAGSTDSDFFAEFEIAITDGTFVASNYVAGDFIL